MKKIIDLNLDIYSKEAIENSLVEFSDVLKGEYNGGKLELEINEEYDLDNVVDEFLNYLLSLMKSSFVGEVKEKIEDKPKKFKSNDVDYFHNFYRFEKGEEDYLLTNDIGDFVFLTTKEFEDYKNNKIENNKELIERLVGKDFLLKDGEYSHLIKKKQDKMSFLYQGPALHIVVVSLRCNLKCIYCHASSVPMNKGGYDMDKETAKKVVDRIFESPSSAITIEFQGGEPLLNYDVVKFIIEYSKEKNKIEKRDLKYALVSNLVYMTDEILDYLIENEVGICTSLDGPEAIHNKNRQCYEATTSWVKKIRDRDYVINALPTISKYSLGYSKELVEEYVILGFDSLFLRQLNPLGSAKNSDIFYSAKEYFDFYRDVLEEIIEKNKEGIKIVESFTQILLKKIFLDTDPNFCELRSPCGAVLGQLLYNYDGKIYSCDEGRMVGDDMFKLGTIDDSYEEIMTNPTSCSIIATSITDVQSCDRCVYKPYCGICPVINYSMSNSIVSNIPSQNRCKILKMQFAYLFNKIRNDDYAKELFLSWLKT